MSGYSVATQPYKIVVRNRILDNVHGQIGLTQVENEIETLSIFKRLHNISQLGLVNRIFPCAVHTRYTHSLGVMHVANMMAESINANRSESFFDDDDIQIIRLAGQLHDIGHYPMSHNIETAYKHKSNPMAPITEQLEEYVNCPDYLKPVRPASAPLKKAFLRKYTGSDGMHHEYIGFCIITNNSDLFKAVRNNYILMRDENGEKVLNRRYHDPSHKDPYSETEVDAITRKIMRVIGNIVIGNYSFPDKGESAASGGIGNEWFDKYSAMVQLIHSEMDADNIDYLLRDATFSGTSYGIMDMSILISAMSVAEVNFNYTDASVKYEGKKYIVGILAKRMGCAEQFLISKYMAYSQVVYSKYVSILEAMLEYVAGKILLGKNSDYTESKLVKMASSSSTDKQYLSFNDSYVLNRIGNSIHDSGGMFTYLNAVICHQINKNLAFYVDKECSSVSVSKKTLVNNMKKNALYKEFCGFCRKLKDKNENSISTSSKMSELFSYRFESYSITEQLPRKAFMSKYSDDQTSNILKFKFNYYRVATGIPVFSDKLSFEFTEDSTISDMPDLIVDLQTSMLHDIYDLGFVYLRKYIIPDPGPVK